jgi:hypothetical protein
MRYLLLSGSGNWAVSMRYYGGASAHCAAAKYLAMIAAGATHRDEGQEPSQRLIAPPASALVVAVTPRCRLFAPNQMPDLAAFFLRGLFCVDDFIDLA